MFLGVVPSTESSGALSDGALVQRLLGRDVRAFEELYDRHSRVVYSLVLRILQQRSVSEEVVQDIFFHLWRNAERYDGTRGAFLPWLLTLARNRALDHLRLKGERQRRREEQAEVLPPVPTAPNFEGLLDEMRLAARVREVMGTLQPQQRRAIELAYFEGLSHSEIASTLQQPLGTVKSWIRNGLLRLKEELQATT